MKKVSKLLALLLVVLMLVSCLTACNTQKEPQDTTAGTTANTGSETTNSEKEEDYLPLVKDGKETLTIGIMQNVKTVDYETNDYTLWLQEQTGVELDFVYFSSDTTEAGQQLTLMMNGGEKLPDILWNFAAVSTAASHEYGQDGYFIDLMPYIEKYGKYYTEAKNQMDDQTSAKMLEIYGQDPSSGALYGMPAYQISQSGDLIDNHLLINKAWLDKLNLEMPTTVDELINVLTKFVNEDPNGNGKKDELGMAGKISKTRGNILEYVINAYVYCCDTYMYNIDKDGNLYFPYSTDEYRQAMITLNKMYKDGLIEPTSFTMVEDAEIMALLTPESGTSITGIAAGHPVLVVAENAENIFEYVGLPTLKDETGLGGHQFLKSASFSWCTYITEDCANPELAFKFLDFMYSRDSVARMRYGMEGTYWVAAEEGLIDDDGVEIKYIVSDTTAFTAQNNATWHSIGTSILEYVKYRTRSDKYDPNEEDTSWTGRKGDWYSEVQRVWFDCPMLDQYFWRVVRNADEAAINTEYSKVFLQYVEQARALFVTGELDPNSDADWKTYLDNLEANGMSKLLESTNAAWDRMNG